VGERSTVNGQWSTTGDAIRNFPPRAFLIALVMRAIIIWACIRVILALCIGMLDAGPWYFLQATTASALALVAGTLAWLEVRRRREHLLLGNLGISQPMLFLTGLVPAVLLESLILLAGHVPA
jgi:hypothetical protein